jgi:hypothetical protein
MAEALLGPEAIQYLKDPANQATIQHGMTAGAIVLIVILIILALVFFFFARKKTGATAGIEHKFDSEFSST